MCRASMAELQNGCGDRVRASFWAGAFVFAGAFVVGGAFVVLSRYGVVPCHVLVCATFLTAGDIPSPF